MPKPKRAPRKPDEKKSDSTRRHLLERALVLFRERGVEATTMRDIAKAAGLSLGAAYYYFPSKEALVFAYYEQNQVVMEQLAESATGNLRDKLGVLIHGKLRSIHDQRHMLGTIVQRLIDPGDPLSAFSAQTRAVRDRAVSIIEKPLRDEGLAPEIARVGAYALWLFMLAMMLVYIKDDSPKQKRTHGLVDDALDMLVPMLPLLATPMGRTLVERIVGALDRAGISMH
ncbi:MAG TPA: TetR/AcrR family transcriptional regulator [Kofleriaceae bacterium]